MQKWLCSILQECACGRPVVCEFTVCSDVAFVSIKDGWMDFSFFQPLDLHHPLPRIRNAFHLKSHMAWYICTSSLLCSPEPHKSSSAYTRLASATKDHARNQTFSFCFPFFEMSCSSVAYRVLLYRLFSCSSPVAQITSSSLSLKSNHQTLSPFCCG